MIHTNIRAVQFNYVRASLKIEILSILVRDSTLYSQHQL